MFIGIDASKKKGKKQDCAEAGVKLKGRLSRALASPVGSSGAGTVHHGIPHWAEMARPPCPHVTLSLYQPLPGHDLGPAGISRLWQSLNSRIDRRQRVLTLKGGCGGCLSVSPTHCLRIDLERHRRGRRSTVGFWTRMSEFISQMHLFPTGALWWIS